MKKLFLPLLLFLTVIISALSLSVTAAGLNVYGIDVSAWQGAVNWSAVSGEKNYVILRAGTTKGKDTYFEANYTGAKAAGLGVGVYMYSYAQSVAEAEADADRMISWLAGKQLEYPVYYDVECSEQTPLGKPLITQMTLAFLAKCKAAGYYCGVYANTNWFTNYIDKTMIVNAGYEIWQAAWTTSGTASSDKSAICGMWQYYSSGSVAGISGRVDMDVCYKDYLTIIKASGLNGWGEKVCFPTYSVTATSLNVRSGPSTSYSVIGSLSQGSMVTVTDTDNGWAQIKYSVAYGWVSMSYLSPLTSGLTHSYTVKVIPPTCTKAGYSAYTCAVCGESVRENEVPMTSHSYTPLVTAPSCTVGGYTTYVCTACGTSYTADETPATGHNYSYTDSGAVRTYTCATCGDSYSENIAVKGDILPDGIINGKDANLLIRYLNGDSEIENFYTADILTDGVINGKDANLLTKYLSGIINSFD